MKILRLPHHPVVGNHINGYGDITKIQQLGNSPVSLIQVKNQTMLIDSTSLSRLRKTSSKKEIYFSRITSIPHIGKRYEMYRYNTGAMHIDNWKMEHVIAAPLIKVQKLWPNLYYCESNWSAYFLYVD